MIAEGIETEAQLAHIRSLGIERSQGYLHGVPVRAGSLGDPLRARPLPSWGSHVPTATISART